MSAPREDPLAEGLLRRLSAGATARLARRFGAARLADAEDAVQEALVRALRAWPRDGLPEDPEAWVLAVAHNQLIDRLRAEGRAARAAQELLARDPAARRGEAEEDALVLLFALAHPALTAPEQVALTLRVLGGFSAREVAAGLLLAEGAAAQRLVRARRKLAEVGEPLAGWRAQWVAERLEAVASAVHLVFNEGWRASVGEPWVRGELVREGLRLAHLLARHPATARPESLALLACLEWTAVRLPARFAPDGVPLGLAEQDRGLWDRAALARGNRAFAASLRAGRPGHWHARAAIAGVHAKAPSYAETDWRELVLHYDTLLALAPSISARLARVVALAKLRGAAEGLRELEAIAHETRAARLPEGPATRGWLLWQLGRRDEAAACYREALALEPNGGARSYLQRRLRALESGARPLE